MTKTTKLLGLLLGLYITIHSFSAASFKIVTNSDQGEYVGGGQSRDISDTNGGSLTITNVSTDTVTFRTKSEELMWMDFTFSASTQEGALTRGKLYYPAQRDAFRQGKNGINIAGDGRGCSNILGGFYVYEYKLNNDGSLESAAIDFVQYCEGKKTESLYGSIRYNSTIPISCSQGNCLKAKQLAGGIIGSNDQPNEELNVAKFQVYANSVGTDAVGDGRFRDFSNKKGYTIDINHANKNSFSVIIDGEKYSRMEFYFAATAQTNLAKNNSYNAKHYFSRGNGAGISISGNGKGCSGVGGFYVHEYTINPTDGTLDSIAIDFFQACNPASSDGIHGSLRYNSSVPVSCKDGNCQKAKQLATSYTNSYNLNKTVTISDIDFDNLNETAQGLWNLRTYTRDSKYANFLAHCNINTLLSYEDDWIDTNVCGAKYIKELTIANSRMAETFGKYTKATEVNDSSTRNIKEIAQSRNDLEKIYSEVQNRQVDSLGEKLGKEAISLKIETIMSFIETIETYLLDNDQIRKLQEEINNKFVNLLNFNSLDDSINFIHSQGMTKYSSQSTYNPNANITREQFSKFIVTYAKNNYTINGYGPDCYLSDIANADQTLAYYIYEGCKLGLIKGGSNKFRPFENLTTLEAIVTLLRLKYGNIDSTSGANRYDEYLPYINKYGLLDNLNSGLFENITRGDVAKLFYKFYYSVE